MAGEACDDGNTKSCDGCSADCRSTETCGNGLVECEEQCDDGPRNSNEPNASCRTGCRRQRCGDDIVDNLSGEDCDGQPPAAKDCQSLGFYAGALKCSACRADVTSCTGSCGDGQVNGAELCDGAPPVGQSCLDYGYDLGNLYCSQLCTPSFQSCQRLGFTSMNYVGTGVFLNTAWGSAESDVFAAGYDGLVLHYDGTAWATMPTPVSETLYGLGGSSAHDVYAVGKVGTLMHFDGTSWVAQDAGVDVQLNTVWSASPTEAFVGARAELQPDGSRVGVMLHSTQPGVWQRQVLPQRDGSDGPRIFGLWGSGPSDVFATSRGEVLHFDGQAWSFMTIPADVHDGLLDLYSIWGSGPNDVFAIGEAGTILHFDGTEWSTMVSGTTTFLNAIDGTGPDDVYVVGEQGLALHYNGRYWAPIDTTTTQALNGLVVKGDQAITVGPGTIQHFTRGTPTLSLLHAPLTSHVGGVWATSSTNVLVASGNGEVARYDGKEWTSIDPPVAGASLWSIWGSTPNDFYVVGGGGTAVHATPATDGGVEWQVLDLKSTETLNWVWGSGPNDIYVVGGAGTLRHFTGTDWVEVPTGVTDFLYAVWGSGPNDVFAVGGNGAVLHFDGQGWSSLDTGTTWEFWGVWGDGQGNTFLFADSHGVLRYDGAHFYPSTVHSTQSFDYGMGRSPTDVFAVEYEGQGLFHFDGVDWVSLRLPPMTSYSVYTTKQLTYVGGDNGDLVEVSRNCATRETLCDDRWDNDCDGLLNCADPDCQGSPACSSGGWCRTLKTLKCGTITSGSTAGGSPMLERYGCPGRYDGREVAYQLTPAQAGTVTLTLTSNDPTLSVLALKAFASGGCDPLGGCVGASPTSGPGAHQVTFSTAGNVPFYVLVDGAAGTGSSFELEVSCP